MMWGFDEHITRQKGLGAVSALQPWSFEFLRHRLQVLPKVDPSAPLLGSVRGGGPGALSSGCGRSCMAGGGGGGGGEG